MQERKKYTMELTTAQAEKMQQLINMTSFAKNVKFVEEVKEVDEREETIKSIKCYMQSCNKELENCPSCQYNSRLTQHRVNIIALKHIQGYKNVIQWLNLKKDFNPISDYVKGFYKAIEEVKKKMEEEFDISEVE